MDRGRDVPAVYPSSYPEQEMDRKSDKEQIYTAPDPPDPSGSPGADLYFRIHDQRHYPVQICVCLPGYQRSQLPCQGDPYDLCLLGICSDVPPFRDPLGDHAGNGKENLPKTFQSQNLDPAAGRDRHSGIWSLCLCEKRHLKLSSDAGTVCVLRL